METSRRSFLTELFSREPTSSLGATKSSLHLEAGEGEEGGECGERQDRTRRAVLVAGAVAGGAAAAALPLLAMTPRTAIAGDEIPDVGGQLGETSEGHMDALEAEIQALIDKWVETIDDKRREVIPTMQAILRQELEAIYRDHMEEWVEAIRVFHREENPLVEGASFPEYKQQAKALVDDLNRKNEALIFICNRILGDPEGVFFGIETESLRAHLDAAAKLPPAEQISQLSTLRDKLYAEIQYGGNGRPNDADDPENGELTELVHNWMYLNGLINQLALDMDRPPAEATPTGSSPDFLGEESTMGRLRYLEGSTVGFKLDKDDLKNPDMTVGPESVDLWNAVAALIVHQKLAEALAGVTLDVRGYAILDDGYTSVLEGVRVGMIRVDQDYNIEGLSPRFTEWLKLQGSTRLERFIEVQLARALGEEVKLTDEETWNSTMDMHPLVSFARDEWVDSPIFPRLRRGKLTVGDWAWLETAQFRLRHMIEHRQFDTETGEFTYHQRYQSHPIPELSEQEWYREMYRNGLLDLDFESSGPGGVRWRLDTLETGVNTTIPRLLMPHTRFEERIHLMDAPEGSQWKGWAEAAHDEASADNYGFRGGIIPRVTLVTPIGEDAGPKRWFPNPPKDLAYVSMEQVGPAFDSSWGFVRTNLDSTGEVDLGEANAIFVYASRQVEGGHEAIGIEEILDWHVSLDLREALLPLAGTAALTHEEPLTQRTVPTPPKPKGYDVKVPGVLRPKPRKPREPLAPLGDLGLRHRK